MRRLPVFLSIIGLISLIGLIGIKGKGLVWAASSSKLGLFLIYSSDGGQKVINACPKIMTFYDPQGDSNRLARLRDYKSKCSGGIVVVRIHIGSEGIKYKLSSDPLLSADDFFQKVTSPAITQLTSTIGPNDYISGTNEFENLPDELADKNSDPKNWEWVGKFWLRLAQNINKAGFKPNIGDINVGHPENLSAIGFLAPYLKEIKKLGGAWSYHGYTVDYSMNNTDSTELDNSLRYRQFNDILRRDPDLASMPLLLTETGAAETGAGVEQKFAGYLTNNKIEEFKTWLTWYDGEIGKDNYVVGATIFQSGETGQWASFNTDYIAEWLCTKLGGTDCKVTVTEYKGSTSTTNSCKPSFADQLTDRMREISTAMQKNFITEQLLRINQGNLPPLNLKSKTGAENEECQNEDTKTFGTVAEGAKLYTIAKAINTPESHNLEESLWETAKKKMETLLGIGGDSAKKWSETGLPPGVADEIYNRDEKTAGLSNLAYKSEGGQVLGISDFFAKIMNQSLFVKYCEGLPQQLCKDNKLIGYKSGESLTPAPSGGPGISIAPPPAGGGGYGSVGKCELGYGYCSVEYLKPFFDNDQIKAEKASQICQRESTSDPTRLNDMCLPKYAPQERTLDYSVGLFQYNLAASNNRCPAGITRDPWDTEGYCRVVNESELAICRNRFYDPTENINKAVALSTSTNSKGISEKGIYWGHWSAAGPNYCDVL